MKIFSYFIKTFKENLRDWPILSLTLVFASLFVFLMKGYLAGTESEDYKLLVYNLDKAGAYSKELVDSWKATVSPEGKLYLKVEETTDLEKAKKKIENKDADILIVIPENFSSTFAQYVKNKKGIIAPLKSIGDPANARYAMAAAFADYTTYGFIGARTGSENPMNVEFEAIGSKDRNIGMFELMVPALLVFSLIMVFFSAGATLVKEVEKGTIIRLMLSKLTAFEFMSAMTLNQLIIGGVCLGLTFLSAYSVGYRTTGSVFLLILVGLAVCFSVIAMGIITVCFIKTMFGLLTVGCFPFFVLMFFSDCMMPLPKVKVFEILGNPVFMNDVLPTAIGVRAMNKVLNFNAGFNDIAFELGLITLLGLMYFAIGAFLFKKTHMSVSK
jgi:ABC-2 type transport system permease protein